MMSIQRVRAIALQDLRILRTDFMPVMVLVIMPLLLMPFLKPAFDLAARVEGFSEATGAEQVVPGMAVTFGFFLVGNVSFGFFREHAWGTWERFRASPATTSEILLGKIVVPFFQAGVQFVLLFGFGALMMDLRVQGSWFELAVVGMAFSLNLVVIGLAVTAVCRTFMQANAIVNIGALLFAGLAGALVPFALLPGWAQNFSPAIPSYWAMQGYEHALLGEGSILEPVFALLGFSTLAALVAWRRFRFHDPKVGLV